MIRVEHLTKNYGPRVAVADVTFEVQKGEVLGFLGPNGAGKTTTMRILTGYLPPSGGRAEVAGFDVATQSLQARANIGYLPETVPLYPDMNVRSYLDFMAKLKGIGERRREVDRAMEKARIAHRAHDAIGKLSKGLRQRAGLAQALLGEPPVLILDEPTSGLDPKQIIETRNLIKSLGGEHTVVLSTHILPEVAATCSRIVIISNGRVVAEDTPANLDRRLKGAESISVTVRGPRDAVVKTLKAVPRVLSVDADTDGRQVSDGLNAFTVQSEVGADIREALASAVVTSGFGLMELRPAHLSLEEIFLQLTTSDTAAGTAA
ncbi:MAG TPA: ABC transporter ATP-binding protein [Chloroflexota bacterium]|jgi:ABC-2 type transport system ATP-binding protein|nr:ABC transporter ATP-binding protein [Chloroflexota bacterium]